MSHLLRREVLQEVILHNSLLHQSLGPEVLLMVLGLDWLLPRVDTLARHALLLGQGHAGGRTVAGACLLGIIFILKAVYYITENLYQETTIDHIEHYVIAATLDNAVEG